MWGQPPGSPVQLSWTVNVPSLDDLGPEIKNGRKRGYRNFNIKIGGDPKFDVNHAAGTPFGTGSSCGLTAIAATTLQRH